MGSNLRDQVFRIVLLGLTAASVCGAQQPDSTPATDADAASAPAAVVPADAPVMAPKVVCSGNQITIAANNSTLSSVLAEVHRCMGTRIDIPDAAGTRRMFDHIGPGPAAQVLDELLSNTGYNYIIGSNPVNEDKIDSIMLLARNAEPGALPVVEDSRAGSVSRRAFLQMHQAAIPHPMVDADGNPIPATVEAVTPEPAPAETAPVASPTTVPADGAPAAADPNAKPAEAAPAQPETPPTPPPAVNSTTGKPMTTQDQITNMQQMFELRKQMNQQPAAPPQ